MKPTDPRVDPALLPQGSRAIVVAESQDEYLDLPSVRTPKGQVVTRWELTDEERMMILNGADVFITILTRGAVQPLQVTVGPMDWKPCPMCNAPDGEPHDYRCPLK